MGPIKTSLGGACRVDGVSGGLREKYKTRQTFKSNQKEKKRYTLKFTRFCGNKKNARDKESSIKKCRLYSTHSFPANSYEIGSLPVFRFINRSIQFY